MNDISLSQFFKYLLMVIVLIAVGKAAFDVVTGRDPQSIAAQEEAAKKNEMAQEAKRIEEDRRTFALKESPFLWNSIQELRAAIKVQNAQMEKLRKAFDDLKMNAEQDTEFIALVKDRDEMVHKLAVVEAELDRAYLASIKYEAARSSQEQRKFDAKASEAGIDEAKQVKLRFDELRKAK